jgi:Histidine kinase-, DNA gyrase B-, and HSP90-like ATPase
LKIIVPVHLAVQAMRDNGYKNAAYALAELMDNSIQAGATQVELLCGEKEELVAERKRSRIHQIAVLDNGSGMSISTLRLALQFGNGLYLDEAKHTGIGRFGMGLPCSSISQCRLVEVWTWQNGVENALYSFLDLDKIKNGELIEVPEPRSAEIPLMWKQIGSGFGQSGTIVVWSKIDKCLWKTAKSIIENSEFLIGRMYRRFLAGDRVKIRLVAFNIDPLFPTPTIDRCAQPNDPCYLMADTSCPAPYGKEPLFNKWADEEYEVVHKIKFRGNEHEVKTRFSYAKEEARQGHNPGATPYGKHAAKNIGVSIMRADRELDLDESWALQYDPRERWWGIEVEFPPALDDLFGVTNNKQSARNFVELGKLDIDEMLKGGKTITTLKEELEQEDDPIAPLLEIADRIKKNLRIIREFIKAQTNTLERASRQRHETNSSPESKATEVTKQRQEDGFIGLSDRDESLPLKERQNSIEQELIEEGLPEQIAFELAASTVSNGLKYVFAEAALSSPAFFDVKQRGGSIVITLNTNHPAYSRLVEILEKDPQGESIEVLKRRLNNASDGLKLLLSAWARYEDEQTRRERAEDTRYDWGRIARQFLESED